MKIRTRLAALAVPSTIATSALAADEPIDRPRAADGAAPAAPGMHEMFVMHAADAGRDGTLAAEQRAFVEAAEQQAFVEAAEQQAFVALDHNGDGAIDAAERSPRPPHPPRQPARVPAGPAGANTVAPGRCDRPPAAGRRQRRADTHIPSAARASSPRGWGYPADDASVGHPGGRLRGRPHVDSRHGAA
jgi:hypothetical protein